jgi:hypothetical protein
MRSASAKKSGRPRRSRGRAHWALRACSPGVARGQGPEPRSRGWIPWRGSKGAQPLGNHPLAGVQRAEPSGQPSSGEDSKGAQPLDLLKTSQRRELGDH